MKSIRPNGKPSRFGIGSKVKTPSGLVGRVIGMAEYRWGWEYRIKVPNRSRTMYRKEDQLKRV